MARRGLVSKSSGGPQGGGNAALMPKGGEKPKGPDLIPLVEVARRLRVELPQVESWVQKDQLRGNDSGVRHYDFKKFQLDYPEEIKRAQKEAFQDKQTRSDRKPKKEGFWGKFGSLLGIGGKADSDPTHHQQQLALENQRLKRELDKLKKAKPAKDQDKGSETSAQDEKIRYLESKLSEARALEAEVTQLRKQLNQPPPPSLPDNSEHLEALRYELEDSRRKLRELEQQAVEAIQLRGALQDAQRHAQDLEERLEQTEQQPVAIPVDDGEIRQLREALTAREHNLLELQSHLSETQHDNRRLREEIEAAVQQVPAPAPTLPPEDTQGPLIQELLELQRINLERFRRLAALYQDSKARVRALEQAEPVEDLESLKSKYEELLSQQNQASTASQNELLDQLASTRATVGLLRTESERLREQLSENNSSEFERQIKELEEQIQELRAKGSSQKLLETELSSLRKGMLAKETQLQKVAARLAENEKKLAKATQESARLTELLVERENRLRDLSVEFEQEYRDKMENLDRQVSGLQWKLSLREERIANLETELLRKST